MNSESDATRTSDVWFLGCRCVWFSVLCLCLTGCFGAREDPLPRAPVRGEVTLDGQPLPAGVIRFIPTGETQGPQTSITVTNGRFEAARHQGPLVGQHRVEILSTDDGGYPLDDEEALERLEQSGVRQIDVLTIPAEYNQRSRLTAVIAADKTNELTFPLTSTGR